MTPIFKEWFVIRYKIWQL